MGLAAIGVVIFLVFGGIVHADASALNYTSLAATSSQFVLDVRARVQCQKKSLAKARCLPASDFLGPHRRLANFSGLLWLLGTVGLTGSEHVLVIGDAGPNKEFVAALLYVMGQRRVSILTTPFSELKNFKSAFGEGRSRTREKIFQRPMRADSLLLRRELAQALSGHRQLVIFDARSENEYWGRELRTMRGGHIPGAQLLPLSLHQFAVKKRPSVQVMPGAQVVVYGRDSYESLVAMARLVASGIKVQALLDGWAGWAVDGSQPVDGATYLDLRNGGLHYGIGGKKQLEATKNLSRKWLLVLGILVLLGVFMAGYFTRKIVAGKGE